MSRIAEFKPVSPEPGRPLYAAVKDAIRSAIDDGRYAPGDQLPSTKALSKQIDVSLVTVHRALQELVSSGVLRRGQGRGTFVHEAYFERVTPSTGVRVGLVFHEEASLSDFYHGHVLEGVRRGAMARGADLVLLQFGEDWRKECLGFVYVNPMRKQLNSMPWFGAQMGTRLRARSTKKPPVVVVGASFDHDHVHSIDTDNVDLAAQAVQHLAALGHRRIAYVGGGAEVSNNVDRWQGFSEAMGRAGLTATENVLRVPGWKLSDGDRARLVMMLTSPNRPTAIFAAGYYFALDLYSVARELELDIPGDLSVIGVDDPPSAQFLSPRLTTLRQPLLDMGRLAAESLMDLAVSPTAHEKRRRLRAELVQRGSTAAPPMNP